MPGILRRRRRLLLVAAVFVDHYDMDTPNPRSDPAGSIRKQCLLADGVRYHKVGWISNRLTDVHIMEHQSVRQMRIDGLVLPALRKIC